MSKKPIKALEFKHANYVIAKDGSRDDLVVVKELIHYEDGEVVPNLRFLKNYPRTFYVTKPGFQNHTDKKEWEDESKLQKYVTTQSRLVGDVAKALGNPGAKGGLRILARSPYLYGTDQPTTTIIKTKYKLKYPDVFTSNTVAVLDIETDVIEGHEKPIYICISYKDKVYLGSTKEFLAGIPNPEEKLQRKARELLGEYFESRNINLEVEISATPGKMCANAIARAHKWQPDFLTIWNIDFDIPRIVKALEDEGIDPAEVFSDPKVPARFKHFKYRQGRTQKVTASGKVSSIDFADRWHIAECPASFHLIDSMCVYRRIRLAKQKENSYGLDAQLKKHLGKHKLKFEDLDVPEGGLEWHQAMQRNHKIEYGVYNIFDCIGVELFDEKLKDLAITITVLCGYSDYTIFDRQPKRLVDNIAVFAMKYKKIVAAVSDDMKTTLDEDVVGRDQWVITLPSHLIEDNGLKIINENPNQSTMIRVAVSDLDISSSYPSTECFLNCSKETTFRELVSVEGVDEMDKRFMGVNLTCAKVNSTEIARAIFKAPKYDELLAEFKLQLEKTA